MTKNINVRKRNGELEPLDINKIHKVVSWACDGAFGVSPSEIEQMAELKFYDGIKTSDLHESLVNATHDLIEKNNQYDLVAGRLALYDVRKKVYGQFEPIRLYDLILKNIADGWYGEDLLEMYSEDEWDKIESFVKHERDFTIRIAGVDEWRSKYLVQNRATKEFKETPQYSYVLTAAIMNKPYGLKKVREYYNNLSTYDITIPTPVVAGLRTKVKQFSSCVLIEVADDLNSICATADAAMQYATRRAGLGISVSSLRADKQPIRGGEARSTGPIGFAKFIGAATASSSQGGLRKGSDNFMHWGLHLDIEDLIVLKNNKGTEETRMRHSDHTILLNGFILRKMMTNEDLHLYSPEEVPDLYEAFFADQEKFEQLYDKYSRSRSVKRKTISAGLLRDQLVGERQGTSRVYTLFVDLANQQGPFLPDVAPIRMTNLCVEVLQTSKPLYKFDDPDGLIALCTLSAINFGNLKSPQDLEIPCRNAVFGLDYLLTYQDYPLQAAKNHTTKYRPLGIGVNNLAYFLARRGLKYGEQETLELLDEYMEYFSYYLTRASVDLAMKYGPCEGYKDTKYSQGIVPMDVRKKAVDELIPHSPRLKDEWEQLRKDLKQYGIRNATLSCVMPSETSSKIANCTNGVEPVRSMRVTKGGRKIIAPDAHRLESKYDLVWDQRGPQGYLRTMAIIQKYIDQSISVNTTYNIEHYPNEQIPAKIVFGDILLAYKYGLKTLYYNNNVKRTEVNMDEPEQEIPVDVVETNNIDDEDSDCCKL